MKMNDPAFQIIRQNEIGDASLGLTNLEYTAITIAAAMYTKVPLYMLVSTAPYIDNISKAAVAAAKDLIGEINAHQVIE